MAEKDDMQNVPEMPEELPAMPEEKYTDFTQESILAEVPQMPAEADNAVPEMPQPEYTPPPVPPMPQAEAPLPPMPEGNPVYSSDDDAYETLSGYGRGRFDEGEDDTPKVSKFALWLQRMQEKIILNKIKLAKIAGIVFGTLLVLYLIIKFTFAYFVEFAFGRIVDKLNLPISSYDVVFADSANLILVNVIDKNGVKIAGEFMVIYNIWDFIFDGKIQEININALDLRAEVKGDTFYFPLLNYMKNNATLSKDDGRPAFSVDKLLINDAKLTFFGEENGQATFSLSGRIANVLTFTAPVKIESDRFAANLETKGSGWGSNYNLTVSFKDGKYMTSFGVPAEVSSAFDVRLEKSELRKWKVNSTCKIGHYDIKADTEGSYDKGILNASVNLSSSEVKEENPEVGMLLTMGRDTLRTKRSPMGTQVNRSQVVRSESADFSGLLPLGDLRVTVSGAKLSGNMAALKGAFPISASSDGITFGDMKTGKAEFAADGVLDCLKGECSYSLNKPVNITIAGLTVPAFNSRFDTKELLNLYVQDEPKPVLKINTKEVYFDMVLLNPALQGAFAGVTTSNVFAMQAEKGVVKGNIDFDGNYQAVLLLDKLAYNDASFTVNGGKLETSLSSEKYPALKFYASFVEMKGDKVLFPPSNLFLEAVPDDYAHRFKLIVQTPMHSSSFFMTGIYDFLKDRGAAKFAIPEITFSADKTPAQVFPFIGSSLQDVAGTFSAKGNIAWGPAGISGPALFSFANFSARKGDIEVSGLNGQFVVTNFNPLTTMPNQMVTVDNLNLMFPFKNVRMKFALNGQEALVVDDFTANVAGGRASNIDQITIPFALNAAPSMIVIKDVDLGTLAKMLNMDIVMSGKLNARLPMALRPNDVQIVIGDIQTSGPGYIKYRPSQTGVPQDNEVDLIFSDLAFSGIRGELDGSLDKSMTLKLKVQGKNPSYKGDQPFRKDIQLKGDFRSLIKAD